MQNFTKGLIRLIGKTKVEDVVNRSGPGWEPGFLNALPGLKEKYPEATSAMIQGSQAHISKKDPLDPKPVVTVALFSAAGTRLGSAHIHEDGSFTDQPSRAGLERMAKPSSAEESGGDQGSS